MFSMSSMLRRVPHHPIQITMENIETMELSFFEKPYSVVSMPSMVLDGCLTTRFK